MYYFSGKTIFVKLVFPEPFSKKLLYKTFPMFYGKNIKSEKHQKIIYISIVTFSKYTSNDFSFSHKSF